MHTEQTQSVFEWIFWHTYNTQGKIILLKLTDFEHIGVSSYLLKAKSHSTISLFKT